MGWQMLVAFACGCLLGGAATIVMITRGVLDHLAKRSLAKRWLRILRRPITLSFRNARLLLAGSRTFSATPPLVHALPPPS
jgi:hypothetical protein